MVFFAKGVLMVYDFIHDHLFVYFVTVRYSRIAAIGGMETSMPTLHRVYIIQSLIIKMLLQAL